MLACPRCDVRLVPLRYRTLRLWQCPSCGGRATTLLGLASGLTPDRAAALRRAVKGSTVDGTTACPACRGRTHGILEGAEACRRCGLFWFDRGPPSAERAALASLTRRASEAAEPRDWAGLAGGFFGLPSELGTPRGIRAWGSVAAALVLVGGALVFTSAARFGFDPHDPWRLHGATLLTRLFLHAGALHLLANAYFLAVFGRNTEECLGWPGFVLLLATGAAAGAGLYGWLDPRGIPLVGSGGAISALLAYYTLAFPRARIGFVAIFYWLTLPGWAVLLLWAGYQSWAADPQPPDAVAVSLLDHLGGVMVGALFWLAERVVARRRSGRVVAPAERGA